MSCGCMISLVVHGASRSEQGGQTRPRSHLHTCSGMQGDKDELRHFLDRQHASSSAERHRVGRLGVLCTWDAKRSQARHAGVESASELPTGKRLHGLCICTRACGDALHSPACTASTRSPSAAGSLAQSIRESSAS
jgi:hypothetical protein